MELYIHLCVLLHMDTICRLRLLPFECNWVPELIDDMALLNGRYQLKVLQCLRRANLPLCGSVKYGQRGVGFDRGES